MDLLKRTWCQLFLIALLPLGARAPAGEEAKDQKPAEAKEAPAPAPKAVEVTVKLLEPGAEPRRELRYRFQAGLVQTMALEMRMLMGMDMGGFKQPEMKVPTTRTIITIEGRDLTPEGNLRYEFKLEGVEVVPEEGNNPAMVETMKETLKGMAGISGHGLVTPRGVTLEADIKAPPNLNQQVRQSLENMRQSLRQLSAPLPVEAVGKGARWEVSMPFDTPMLKLVQHATYTLADLDADRLKLEADVQQSAPEQEIKQPGLPPGFKLMLKSMSATGSSAIDLDLLRLVPRSTVKTSSTSEMEGAGADPTQQMQMKMSMKMEVSIAPVEKGAEKKEAKEAKEPKEPKEAKEAKEPEESKK
jgi:hypothetical protein